MPGFADRIERRKGDEHFVPDAADANYETLNVFLEKLARQVSDHGAWRLSVGGSLACRQLRCSRGTRAAPDVGARPACA